MSRRGKDRPQVDESAEARRQLEPLIAYLTGPDEEVRRKAADAAKRTQNTPVFGLVMDLMLERLARAEGAGREALNAGLAALGGPAADRTVEELRRTRNAATRVRLVEALAAVALALPPAERVPIFFALDVQLNNDPAEDVSAACERAMALIHPINTTGSPSFRECGRVFSWPLPENDL